MDFFADSSNINEIQKLTKYGLINGVTTNPSLIAKEDHTMHWHKVVHKICEIVQGPVSAEVTQTNDSQSMFDEGMELSKIHHFVVVKLPCTPEAIKACQQLSDNNIRVNMTLCFSVAQAMMAENAGATYISPFMGRLDDHTDGTGVGLVKDIYDANQNYLMKILAASVRSVEHINQVAKYADVVTCPPKVIWDIFRHKLTLQGIDQFNNDWKKVK